MFNRGIDEEDRTYGTRIGSYLHYTPDFFDGERQKWFLLYFDGVKKDINLHVQRRPEFIRFRWAQPEKAPFLVIPFKKEVYDQVIAEFAPKIANFNPEEI